MSDTSQSGTNTAELFGSDRMWGLKELPLPQPVSWWPQTVGWYILGIALLSGLAWLCWKQWKHYQHNVYRRRGLAYLDAIGDNQASLKDLPYWLRKSALCAASRAEVAGLRGRSWIHWLNKSAGSELFQENDAMLLEKLTFTSEQSSLVDQDSARHLIEASKRWMRSHRASV